MLCSKLGSRAPAGHPQVVMATSRPVASFMEVEPGELGDELAGAPTALCPSSASQAPFPFVVRPIAASQLQLGQPLQATSKMHDVAWLAGN